MTVRDDKYLVLKREDFDRIAEDKGTATKNEFLRAEVEDAVVIRRQDVFAPPALDAYANAIETAIQIIGAEDVVTPRVQQRLREIADYFHGQATLAWDTDRKIPD